MDWRLAHIFRHPVKAHGREAPDAVTLAQGRCLPRDRHWALALEGTALMPGWNPCMNFARGARVPTLQAIGAEWNDATGLLTLTHPDLSPLTIDPDSAAGAAALLDWVALLQPPGRARPARLVSAGRGMTDTAFESVSVLNQASNAALGRHLGAALGLDRWRANLWLDGMPPWAERDLVGQTLQIGDAQLKVVEPIGRCRATMVDCATGMLDHDILSALQSVTGGTEFGVYATVTRGGPVTVGAAAGLAA